MGAGDDVNNIKLSSHSLWAATSQVHDEPYTRPIQVRFDLMTRCEWRTRCRVDELACVQQKHTRRLGQSEILEMDWVTMIRWVCALNAPTHSDSLPFFQCCCPRGKSLSSRILEDQFSSPCSCPCPRPRQFKSSKIVKDCVDYKTSCMHFLRRFSAHQRLRPLLNACSAPVDCSCGHTVHAWATNCWVSWWW